VTPALPFINLVPQIDCPFRTGSHAFIAAHAQVQIDEIALSPYDLKVAKPSLNLDMATAEHRVGTLPRQGSTTAKLVDAANAAEVIRTRITGVVTGAGN
jgi:hypothetical protein